MAEGNYLVLYINLSFVSSRRTNVSCQVENTTTTWARHVELLGLITHVSRCFNISLCMNDLSSTLKWRDRVAMGLHVGNMFVNRENRLLKEQTQRMSCQWEMGSLDQVLTHRLNFRCLCCF